MLPSHKNKKFLTMSTKMFTFPRVEETSLGQPKPATNRKGQVRMRKSMSSLWTETGKDEERICKEK